MKYRILVPLALVLLVNCVKKNTEKRPLLTYVPEKASLIIKITNHETFKDIIKNNDFLSELSATETYQKALNKVSYLSYVKPNSEGLLAFTEVGANTYEFTYVTKKDANLFHLDSIKDKTVETIEFANATFEKYTIAKDIFYSLEVGDKIILSSSKLLLEELDQPFKPFQSEILQKLYGTSNIAKPASILINLNGINASLKSQLRENSEVDVSGFSDWISLDLDQNNKNLHLSGISIANDSTWNYVDLLANTKPTTNNTPFFAPAESDAILSYTYDDYKAFSKNRELSTGLVSSKTPSLEAVEEIGIIYLNGKKNVVLNTFGAETIAEYLKEGKKGSIEFQGNEILELRKTDFLNVRFSPLVKNFKANFCAIIKNAFVFSENQAALKTIIKNHKNGTTFNQTAVYQTLENEIAKESSILFIANSNKINQILNDNFSTDFVRDIKKGKLSDYAYAAQTITDKNFYHTNVVVQKTLNTNRKTGASSLFSVKFSDELATNPQFVTNHLNKKKEIVVQDEKNALYLISSTGKILWKKQLKSMIQGRIQQVDIFKNGRLQLAFTTNDQLMILDRNGKEVKQFTKTFEGGNLNPLAVFDYEKKKNYRFVVTQNTNTFMYDSKAKIVKGFKFTKAEHPIIASPKHLVIGSKDYLVFKLKDGSLKLLNRLGDIRTKVNEKIDFSENEVFVYKNRFALTDNKGVLHEIDPKGKIKKTALNLSTDHGLFTTGKTLATMNENMLSIKGEQIELEMGVYTPPKIFYLNDKIYVSVTDLQNEKIYLFDSQAKSIANFPLSGASSIDIQDIENDKTLDIVTKMNKTSLEVYKLN